MKVRANTNEHRQLGESMDHASTNRRGFIVGSAFSAAMISVGCALGATSGVTTNSGDWYDHNDLHEERSAQMAVGFLEGN
jgi:hypothetical protein